MNDSPNTLPAERQALTRENAAAIRIGGGKLIQIGTAAEARDFALMMAGANIALPKHLRGQPGVCLAVVMQAVQWGADPFQVANKSYSVNDRLAYEAQLYAALLIASGLIDRPRYSYEGEAGTTRRCTVTIAPKGGGAPFVYTSPQVQKIHPKNSPLWKTDEDQQLAYYSIRACGRRDFPDVLLGFLSTDEAASLPAEDRPAQPVKASTVDKLDALAGGADVEDAEVVGQPEPVADRAPPAEEKPKATRGSRKKADPPPTKVLEDPLVKQALDTFPKSEVVDVRTNAAEAGTDEANELWDDEGDEAATQQPAEPGGSEWDGDYADEEAAEPEITTEEERIQIRMAEMDGVPPSIRDDVVQARQYLAGFDAATNGVSRKMIPPEIACKERQAEGFAWLRGHDRVTGYVPPKKG